MKFNEKIVRLRKIKGITQDEFASAVGVSRQAVYKWECGQSYPEVAKLIEIKLLFGISIDDLLDESYEIALPEKKKRKRLPKTEKKAIEQEVKHQVETEAVPVAAVSESVNEEAAPAATEDFIEIKEPQNDTEKVDAPVEENVKKVGFFGRIFGRK